MRIDFVTEPSEPSIRGVPESVYALARAAHDAGNRVRVITGSVGGTGVLGLADDDVLRIGQSRAVTFRNRLRWLTRGPGISQALRETLEDDPPDVVHVEAPGDPVLP